MKIAITGSLGLIGSSLIKKLRETSIESIEIVAFDIRYNKQNPFYLDITNKDQLKQKLQDCDGVLHLAAIARVSWGEKNPVLCNLVNIDGIQNIIDTCLSSRKKPWLIFASSREVYGTQDTLSPALESASLSPLNTYAKTKLIGEQLIKEAHKKGLKAFIARFANVYGGMFDHRDRVIPAFIINAINNQDIEIKGKDAILDFIFIDDVINSLIKIIDFLQEKKEKYLPIVNISTSEAISLNQLANIIISATHSTSNIISLPKNSFAVDQFCGSNSLASSILGWEPKFDLKQGVKKFIQNLNSKTKGSIDVNTINMRLEEDESFKSYSWLPAEI